VLCNKAFDVPSGILIRTDNVTLDCNGAIIRGTGLQDNQGIIIERADDITIKNCNILNFDVGIYIKEGDRNTITHNALLKNRIGVRLLEAFENRFEGNADKSLLKPVSALGSKFNTFWLTNKDLDKDFCEVNLCNNPGPMDPCVDDDKYCSPSCTHENDNDCREPVDLTPITEYPKLPNEEELVSPVRPAQEAMHEAQVAIEQPRVPSLMGFLPEKARIWAIVLLAIAAYLLGFLAFQHHHWHH
jgi:parallel beta-helix repeat protein